MLCCQTCPKRVTIGRNEHMQFVPSIEQLEKLAEVLSFDLSSIFVESKSAVYTASRISSRRGFAGIYGIHAERALVRDRQTRIVIRFCGFFLYVCPGINIGSGSTGSPEVRYLSPFFVHERNIPVPVFP